MTDPERYIDGTADEDLQQLVARVEEHMSAIDLGVEAAEQAASTPRSRTGVTGTPSLDKCTPAAVAAPLDLPDFVAQAGEIASSGFYDERLVLEALSSLAVGHLILTGPPGTGKTRLARELGAAFTAEMHEHTGNPEWSVYDMIGSVTLNHSGGVSPKHGLVTRAIVDCCATVNASLEGESENQAVWLLIDEINRADIDRAFGPLFTALADPTGGQLLLDYLEEPTAIVIPSRFRIIGTLNSFDTRFVNSMSAALRRRFARVAILPPENASDGIPAREFTVALEQAKRTVANTFGMGDSEVAASALRSVEGDLRGFLGAIRDSGDLGGIPFGTAQVIDSCAFAMTLFLTEGIPPAEAERKVRVDRALAARLMTSLESDSARQRIQSGFLEQLREKHDFPGTLERLEAFLAGWD